MCAPVKRAIADPINSIHSDAYHQNDFKSTDCCKYVHVHENFRCRTSQKRGTQVRVRDLGDQLELRLRRKKLEWALRGMEVRSALDWSAYEAILGRGFHNKLVLKKLVKLGEISYLTNIGENTFFHFR